MQLAKIGELLNKSYKTPDKATEPNAYNVHETKDNYLKSCLITATTSTNAYPYIMDMSLTGCDAYFALKTAFQGDDYNQRAAEKASHTLYGLSFGLKCNMTADGYVAEFLTQVNIIAECGDPISEISSPYTISPSSHSSELQNLETNRMQQRNYSHQLNEGSIPFL